MLYEVTVKQVPAQHVAVLRRRTTAATIGDDVGRSFGAVGAAVAAPAPGSPARRSS